MRNALINGDCIEVMRSLDADSIDAIVTDPPYGLEFMGKEWDGWDTPHAFGEWCRQWATEALRVLRPGGHLLAFGGTRMYHRLAAGVEDAGFEIRDTIAWLYGQGFPKSLDVSKAIDKAAGAERERYERSAFGGTFSDDNGSTYGTAICNTPATDAARDWSGFGTALKPAHEPIVVARKPLIGTVAQNVQAHGTGALNIDGCRIAMPADDAEAIRAKGGFTRAGWAMRATATYNSNSAEHPMPTRDVNPSPLGRWPANVAHDGSPEVLELFPETGPAKTGERQTRKFGTAAYGDYRGMPGRITGHDDTGGSAARFFYCAKASRADREAGLVGLPERAARANDHPTVKPHDLMRWLVRLVGGQPGSLILDPFAGSGSTLRAAQAEGFDFLGIERDRHYYRLASLRAGLPDPGETDEEMC